MQILIMTFLVYNGQYKLKGLGSSFTNVHDTGRYIPQTSKDWEVGN
jgi:hypothetical protein